VQSYSSRILFLKKRLFKKAPSGAFFI